MRGADCEGYGMNRQQAEHILEAYINLECSGGDNNARAALREVILDAMTSYSNFSGTSYPRITLPGITVPNVTTPTTTKPIVTCDAGGVQ